MATTARCGSGNARDGRQLLSFDNGSKVVALGFSPAGDAVFAATAIASAHGGARTVIFSLARETRPRAALQRVIARFTSR